MPTPTEIVDTAMRPSVFLMFVLAFMWGVFAATLETC